MGYYSDFDLSRTAEDAELDRRDGYPAFVSQESRAMRITYYPAEMVLTLAQQQQHRVWLGLKNWTDGKVVVGAIKVGSRWQPLRARCVASSTGYFSHWADVTVLEARGYATMRAACQAARRLADTALATVES